MLTRERFDHWLVGSSVLLIEARSPDAFRFHSWLTEAGATVTAMQHVPASLDAFEGRMGEYDAAVIGVEGAQDPHLQLASRLRSGPPACSVLIQSEDTSPDLLQKVRGLGAGFLSKNAKQADFMFTLSRLLDNNVPNIEILTAKARKRWRLSRQQTRLLYYNLWSLSNQEIARALGVSLHTVQEYQQTLRSKTGARTKDGYLRRLLECSGRLPPAIPE